MSVFFKWAVPAVALTLALSQTRAETPYDGMLGRVPEQANVLVVVNNEALLKSSLGIQQNWDKNYKKTSLGGLFGSPPHLLRLVLAAQIDHHTLENQWEVGISELLYDVTNKSLVEATGGARDSVGGHEVTLTPQNSYLTLFNPHQVGVMRPANRQSLSRWMRTTGLVGSARISPFLQQSIDNLPKDAQAQLAIDLNDMFEAEGLRQRFKKSKALADGNVDVEAATKLFSMVKGLTLALRIDNDIKGELRVYFEESPTFLEPVAKKMLSNALTSIGASIEDIDDWDTSVDGKAIVLRGKLTQSNAQRIFSPLFAPIADVAKDSDAGGNPAAAASKRYFTAVQSLIDDLKATKARSLSERSFWHKQFADKIDALPVLNVDGDLLKFGAAVSTTFRGLANFATNTLQQERLAASNSGGYTVTPGASYYYGNGAGWGYGGTFPAVQSNYTVARNLISQEGNNEIAVRNATWKNIEAATTDIRNRMTQKYRVDFQ
jgi:hypothetical protein